MYLDMNGIIHVCSHPDDTNVHFRMSEEQMFQSILHYIDTLFRMIQPRKLFFMAVDGVAPRAKMNQQRGRRLVSQPLFDALFPPLMLRNNFMFTIPDFSQRKLPWI